jgi:hypothetical protein
MERTHRLRVNGSDRSVVVDDETPLLYVRLGRLPDRARSAQFPCRLRSLHRAAGVRIELVNRPDKPPTAAGANAIFDATGKRLRQAPFTPTRVKALL